MLHTEESRKIGEKVEPHAAARAWLRRRLAWDERLAGLERRPRSAAPGRLVVSAPPRRGARGGELRCRA
jgi:hypothetical protein